MLKKSFVFRTRIAAPVEEVFQWHVRPGAFERLVPPWEPVEVVERSGKIEDGARVVLKTKIGPFDSRWVIRHEDLIENRQFRDIQVSGPFAEWQHMHRFEPDGPSACQMEDSIEYVLPGGSLGEQLGGAFVRHRLERVFRYRHQILAQDLALHHKYKPHAPLRILVSGSTGLIGSSLVPFFTTGGHQVTRLVRTEPKPGECAIRWQPSTDQMDTRRLEGFDAVIHLAGENITGFWSEEKKRRIRESRVRGTRLLSEALASLQNPPRIFLCASATGYYGDRGGEVLTEESGPGEGFLAGVCRQWEEATEPAARSGIRVANLRFGVILTPKGGALAKMLLPFKLGLGGRMGDGQQYLSWIAIDDVIGGINHVLMTEALKGPVNFVAPDPIKNYLFTEILGEALSRPTLIRIPAAALRSLMGEMADEMLLASVRAMPSRLSATEYSFLYSDLACALKHLFGKAQAQDMRE